MGLAGEWWFLEAKMWVKVEMQWSEVSGRDLVGLGMKDERERERERERKLFVGGVFVCVATCL